MREQVKILLMMIASLAIIVSYALLPGTVIFNDFSLRKISLAQLQKPVKKSSPTTAHKQKNKKNKRYHTFLFIGDSMVEGLSRRMGDYAKENGHQLYTIIWYSSTTEKWAESQTIEHFIEKYKPTYVLLCLGSNELFVKDLDVREQYIETIVKKLRDLPFIWIGPASWNGDTGIIDLISKHTEKGYFFDSRGLKLERGKDHYHPTWEAAALWQNKVCAFMSSKKAAYPVILKVPKGHHKATKTKLLQPDFEGF